MLDLFNSFNSTDNHTPPISEEELKDSDVILEIKALKEELKDRVIILGHHYQQDEIIQFADVRGDSLILAQVAAKSPNPFIIFCGVHFMAESADMLSTKDQQVILPDLSAGCSMADMATGEDIEEAWKFISKATNEKVIPITYINCTAELKAFVGRNNGTICTSSNAKKIITWGLTQGEKLLFFPDQHLGRNTCFDLGISLSDMVLYDPNKKNGGLTEEKIKKAKVILWYGYCSVHQGFTKEQAISLKEKSPETTIIVHPECSFEVVQASDLAGSTAYIIEQIKSAPAGSKFAVGTEINLVNRLAHEFKDKDIKSLSPFQCLCTTMYRIRPRWLLASLRSIKDEKPINVIKVPEDITKNALVALNRMLNI